MRVEPKTFHFFGIRFLFWLLLYSLSLSLARFSIKATRAHACSLSALASCE